MDDGFHFFYVNDCPIEIKTWKGGPKKGKPYASAEDCKVCVLCNKLELWEYHRTEFIKYLFPNRVDCLGHLVKAKGKEKYHIRGEGPEKYYGAKGRLVVIDKQGQQKYFYRFYKAYGFYQNAGTASILNAETGELIEQKVLKEEGKAP